MRLCDAWPLLGVAEGTPMDEVKASFRRLARLSSAPDAAHSMQVHEKSRKN
jgi:hypothetical protein